MMSMQNPEMETPRSSSSSWSMMSGPPCQTWATPKSQGRIPNSSKRGCDHGEMEVDSKTQVVRNQAAVENWAEHSECGGASARFGGSSHDRADDDSAQGVDLLPDMVPGPGNDYEPSDETNTAAVHREFDSAVAGHVSPREKES